MGGGDDARQKGQKREGLFHGTILAHLRVIGYIRKMKTLTLCAVLLAAPAAAAPKAPNIKLAVIQNAPVPKIGGLADLKGKVVFLEFWATWCQPCVAGIPHVNRVIDALKGEPVVFLSVTDEPADMLATFRKTHEMKAWVGIDEAGSVLKSYHVSSRPAGYLIGKDGTLLASIFPDDLKEKDLRDALAGTFKPKAVSWEKGPSRPKSDGASAGKTYFEARISAASGKPGMSEGADGLEATSLDFASNVAWIWDVQTDQVLIDTPPVSAFNFTLKTPPEGFEQGREMLKSAVQSAFGVRVAPEKQDAEVLVLTLSAAKDAPRPKAGAEGGKSGLMAYGGGRLLGKVPMGEVARALWMGLGKPVVDETGLKGRYDLSVSYTAVDRVQAAPSANGTAEPDGTETLFDALPRQLGLKLEKRKRPLPALVLDHIDPKPAAN